MTGCRPRDSTPTQLAEIGVARIWTGEHTDCPIIPEEEWEVTEDLKPWDSQHDLDRYQNGYPSCTLHSWATWEGFWSAVSGLPVQPVDAHRAWRRLSGGRGGVALDTALRYAEVDGMPLKDGQGRIYVTEVWDLPTVAAFHSALQCGVLPWYGRRIGGGGHAEVALQYLGNGEHLVLGTWGRNYGDNGYYEVKIRQSDITAFGAFGIRSRKIDEDDLNP
jgi:hypothetical protein